MDPVATYLDTFEALRKRKRWSANTIVLRYAALTLASLDLAEPYAALEQAAAELRRRAGWFGPLKSETRYAVAAMILRRKLDPGRVHARVLRTRKAMRSYKLPRNSMATTFAALLLVLQADGGAVPAETLRRMERIYRAWREDHFWLTGSDDLPAAAVHAARDEPIDSLTSNVERGYATLRTAGFSRGNQLQLVSHLLAVDPRGVDAAVQRFRRIAGVLRDSREHIRSSRYDEVALLALTSTPPTPLVKSVLEIRDRLRAARPRPSREIALSLAAGIALSDDVRRAEARGAGDLTMLRAVQAILDAQQAAVAAAIAASAAASSAAAAG